MSFLLDTDICSEHLKGNRRVQGRFLQNTGNLYVSTITLAELYAWTNRTGAPRSRAEGVNELLADVKVLDVDLAVATQYGQTQAALLDQGQPIPSMDLLIAATALVHGLTMVTHNTKDFVRVPNLTVIDWLVT